MDKKQGKKQDWQQSHSKDDSGSDMSRASDPAHHKGSTLIHGVYWIGYDAYHLGIISSHK